MELLEYERAVCALKDADNERFKRLIRMKKLNRTDLHAFAVMLNTGQRFTQFKTFEGAEPFAQERTVQYISDALHTDITLRVLHLNYFLDRKNRRIAGYISGFARALSVNATLQELSLVGNALIDADVNVLEVGLRSNRGLIFLDLSKNQLTAGSGKYLAMIILKTPALKTLWLCHNGIRGGVAPIAEALATNPALTSLSLCQNGIEAQDLLLFTDVIQQNTHLHKLFLAHNSMDVNIAKYLSRALVDNMSLMFLNFENARLQTHGAREDLQVDCERMARCLAMNCRRVLTLDSLHTACAVVLARTSSLHYGTSQIYPQHVQIKVKYIQKYMHEMCGCM